MKKIFLIDKYLAMSPASFKKSISHQIKNNSVSLNKVIVLKLFMVINQDYEKAAICLDFEKELCKVQEQSLFHVSTLKERYGE